MKTNNYLTTNKRYYIIACFTVFFIFFALFTTLYNLYCLRGMTNSLKASFEKELLEMRKSNNELAKKLVLKKTVESDALNVIISDSDKLTLKRMRKYEPKSPKKKNLEKKRRSWKDLTNL